jgi:hypothetical protein
VVNIQHLNNVRREVCRHIGDEKKDCLKAKADELEIKNKMKKHHRLV